MYKNSVNGLCSMLVQFYCCDNIVVKSDFTDCCHGFSQALWPSGCPIIRSCWRVSCLWCCMVYPTRICPWLVSQLWRESVESVDMTSTFTPMTSWPSHRFKKTFRLEVPLQLHQTVISELCTKLMVVFLVSGGACQRHP